MDRSRALVSVKMRRVEGKSNSSSAVDVSADVDGSEGRVYSNEGSMGDIFE